MYLGVEHLTLYSQELKRKPMLLFEIQFAGLLIAVGAGVVSKICYDWLANGRNKKSGSIEIAIQDIKDVVTKSDDEGALLIYTPREAIKLAREHNERSIETNFILKEIKELLQTNALELRDLKREIQSLK